MEENKRYIFILGRNPALSVAEIFSFFSKEHIDVSEPIPSDEALIITTSKAIDSSIWIKEMGGVIKIGEVIDVLDLNTSEKEWDEIFSFAELKKHFFSEVSGKVRFGISLYFLNTNLPFIKNAKKLIQDLSGKIKDQLRREGFSAGFVKFKDRSLSSVSVEKNKLLVKGAEILLLASKDKIYIGKTLTVQTFASYSFRDFGRPQRDTHSGILPPKIAQIMLNLAQIPKSAAILDPFCGSGTIITEALLSGYEHIYGADISGKAINDTKINIDWIKKHFQTRITESQKINLHQSDVKNIATILPPHTLDAIVTEPLLGPPLFRRPDQRVINNILNDLKTLYLSAFKEFVTVLKRHGKVVTIFPAFTINKSLVLMDILSEITSYGFGINQILPQDLQPLYQNFLTHRDTIVYGRGDEFAKREIIVLNYKG